MPTWLTRIGLVRTLIADARLAVRLLREPRVPALTKALPLLALVYLISPVDFVPDLIPLLGQVDDLGVLVAITELFRRLSPPAVVAYHRSAVTRRQRYAPMPSDDDVVDAEFRRE